MIDTEIRLLGISGSMAIANLGDGGSHSGG